MNHQPAPFSDADPRMFPVIKELQKLAEFNLVTALISMPKAIQYPCMLSLILVLVENHMFLHSFKEQLSSLIQTGFTWDQLLLMGLDDVICAAFSPGSPDHKQTRSHLVLKRKRNRIEAGALELIASKRPLFVPDQQEAVFSLSDSDGSINERKFSFTAHYKSKADTLSKNISNIQKNMEYLKRKIENAKKNGSNTFEDDQSKESFTPKVVTEMNSSNRGSLIVPDSSELQNLKKKLTEIQNDFASNENELKDTSQLSVILSMKLEKLNPLVNSMLEELSMVNFKITELCDKRKLIQTNLDRYRAEAEDSNLKKQNTLLKISKLKKQQEQLKNDISKLKDSILTYDLRQDTKTDKEKVLYFSDLEYFFEYEEGYLLVESDLISSAQLSRSPSVNEIRKILNEYYKGLSLCPIEADGSICLNENCVNSHFSDSQKTDDEKLKDWICKSGNQIKIRMLLKSYDEEMSIDSFLGDPSNQAFLFNLMAKDLEFASTTKTDNFYSILIHQPVSTPFLLYFQSEESAKRLRYFDPKLSLETLQKKIMEDPNNIQNWISLVVLHLPQKIDHISIKKCSLSLAALKDALKVNPMSSILLILYLELLQYTDDLFLIRDEFENALCKAPSLHIRFMYFQWEKNEVDKIAILVDIIKSCIGKDPSPQNSLALVNAFTQIIKYDEEGVEMVKKLFKIDPDDEHDQENFEETILNMMEPKHQCFLLLCSICYIFLGYVPGYLFHDHPFRYMSIAIPFLIEWRFVHREDRLDEACELLHFGVDFFILAGEFALANVILRNLVAVKMNVLCQSPDVIMDLFEGLPFDKNFKLTEYILKCKFNSNIEPSSIFFDNPWINSEIKSGVQSYVETSFACLNIAAKIYLDRGDRDSYSKLVYNGGCVLLGQSPIDIIDIPTEEINEMILELFDNYFSKKSPSESFLAYTFYLSYRWKCGRESRLEGISYHNNSELQKYSRILLSKLYLQWKLNSTFDTNEIVNSFGEVLEFNNIVEEYPFSLISDLKIDLNLTMKNTVYVEDKLLSVLNQCQIKAIIPAILNSLILRFNDLVIPKIFVEVFSSGSKQIYSGEYWKLLLDYSKIPVWKLLKAADLFLTRAEVKLFRLLSYS